ncbi:MAG TPA: glycoside hydrolase family 44 protein, partial [Terriglobales bacterium]|nr:glycoside hydrolase family 44 protein [Terriglobales bacterium]
VTPVANTWTRIDMNLAEFGDDTAVNYIHWFNNTPGSQPVYYLDDIAFLASGNPTPTPLPPGAGPALSVDLSASRRPISPYIYGMNFTDENLAEELALPVRRWGGNATTRYNWQNDTSNRAFDWYFENIPNENPNPGALPNGSSSDRFIEQNLRTGTETLMTVPLIGWTPKARLQSCGFSVSKYGAQQSTDPWMSDCGNGVRSNGAHVTGNDPTDTSTAITPAFVQAWMTHMIGRYGSATDGGVRFYNLDNEPELWDDTHRDVHPEPTSYDELRDRTFAYAPAIKAIDPDALTLGPASWGWSAYFWSALDWAPGGDWWNHPQDRLAHGNTPFIEWYLQQMRSYEQQQGVRPPRLSRPALLSAGTGGFALRAGQHFDPSLAAALDALAVGPELRR